MNGFKVGFGTPEAMAKLGIERPLVAPISDRTLLPDDATVDLTGWKNPMIELEVAVHVGGGLSAAIELADVHPPPEDPDTILAGDIYHRHWIIGPVIDAPPVRGRLTRDGTPIADDGTPLDHEAIIRDVEATIGRALAPGEVVITGSIFPPQPAVPGRWEGEVEPPGRLVVTLEGA
jgi:2-keto-4-pentenoate hydratase